MTHERTLQRLKSLQTASQKNHESKQVIVRLEC